jgi:hypothetical protein
MKLTLLLLAAALAAPVHAADKPLFLTGGPKAEDALRRFVERDPKLKAKLDDAAQREEKNVAALRDPDLRDSVADTGRSGLLSRLPGMKAPPPPTCLALADCAKPDLSAEVSDASLVPDALRRLVRPWMMLQQARGSEVVLSAETGAGDAALKVGLKGLSAAPLTVNVAPGAAGGFRVWFDRPQELAALYVRERDAALKAKR